MNNFKHLRNVLFHEIMALSKSSSLFTESSVDFSRNRKLNFETVIKQIICMEAGSLKDELLKYFDFF